MKYFLIVFAVFLLSCSNEDDPGKKASTGKLMINFEHFADGKMLDLDNMKYTNAAGNEYEVTEVQWFVSDLTLHKSDGSKMLLGGEGFSHYIDTNIPATYQWELPDEIPAGDYTSISMVFGITGDKNIPLYFTDPPESNMAWPINLGGDNGGYHYMKLNGFWMNAKDERQPFNFHLGVGQERDADNNITGFVQNWFEVDLPASAISMAANEHKSIAIRMNVEKWWDQPNQYNFDVYGPMTMQNQAAMAAAKENGQHVFTIGSVETIPAE